MARYLQPGSVGPGFYAHPAGDRGLREAIARHIGISRGVLARADDVCVTNGTQQALDIVVRALLSPGDCVAVEDPNYPPPCLLFRSLGLRVTPVPVDDHGMIVDALPDEARVVYVTPSHQFPLGVTMSLQRRGALLAWAERRNAAIIEDDYDSEFRLGGRPLEPLQTLDGSGRVIYVGSFSKTMLPTLRLGFVVTPPSISRAVHAAKFVTDWHSALPPQAAMADFLDDGSFARHIRKMSAVYRARHQLITGILKADFRGLLEVIPSAAGLHISAISPKLTAMEIVSASRRAAELGVAFQRLSTFGIEHKPAGAVIGYGAIATGQIEEGLRLLRSSFN
jgi:GntR family transcriptional regulator/MocR family aminotransferase